MMLEDLDHEAAEKLGLNFLKTICDDTGFAFDQKYKTPQPTRTTVLITSNYTIPEIIGSDTKGIEQAKAAMYRRYWHVRIDKFLACIGLKMIDKYERTRLKSEGNEDVSLLFMSWDYMTDAPTGLPLKPVEEYQEMIRSEFYKN
jgi:hypothetical protein